MKNKILKRIIMSFGVIIIVVGLFFSVYVLDYEKSNTSIDDYSNIEVRDNDLILSTVNPSSRIVFYPGAKVEIEAYLPLMERLSTYNYEVIIINMPFNLAFFDQNAVNDYLDTELPVYLMGHSLGGAMAASYASTSTDIDGLILLAAYATKEFVNTDLKVLSIYGSLDTVLNIETYNQNKKYLPNLTEYVINDGNHSGFGDYGLQNKDTKALISGDSQKDITAEIINDFIGG